jgi:hypothetical protein
MNDKMSRYLGEMADDAAELTAATTLHLCRDLNLSSVQVSIVSEALTKLICNVVQLTAELLQEVEQEGSVERQQLSSRARSSA